MMFPSPNPTSILTESLVKYFINNSKLKIASLISGLKIDYIFNVNVNSKKLRVNKGYI